MTESTTESRQELRTKWIAALRSGEYKQSFHLLRSTEKSFCCLGVLCDIVDSSAWEKNRFNPFSSKAPPTYSYVYVDESGTKNRALTDKVSNLVGLKTHTRSFGSGTEAEVIPTGEGELTTMNDTLGLSFEQIADALETNPKMFFKESSP